MDLSKIVITDIFHVLSTHSPQNQVGEMINRPHYGLSFTEEGVIEYRHKGKSFVSDKNHAIILPKGQSYNIHRREEGNFAVINFECENFFTDTIVELPIKDISPILKEFTHMKKLDISGDNQLMVKSCMYKILHHLTDYNPVKLTPLTPALTYIEQNYFCDISNEILARLCSFNEDYFRKQFKKIYGISPKQCLIDRRITVAKQLLTEGTLKIYDVSKKCGFSNPYHFCRIFKEKTGMTPTEYACKNMIYNL